jgi:hypothetical protein
MSDGQLARLDAASFEGAAGEDRGGAASRSGAPSGISFVASAREIAINMDAMAKAGTLELIATDRSFSRKPGSIDYPEQEANRLGVSDLINARV